MSEDKVKCSLCGSEELNDLGHGSFKGTVICLKCKAHWWDRWYSWLEWGIWINGPKPEKGPTVG